ncbi:MAG: hypothetical protein Ta2A_20040 [Treponemataceae bacterium]|nr:MAG: hypothetical protein Ta2A_20040 [Treponemataceae bacterium]
MDEDSVGEGRCGLWLIPNFEFMVEGNKEKMQEFALADRKIATTLPAFVMGIVNLTDDSFYEKSRKKTAQAAADAALRMQDEGADIIDLGAESTRPGSCYVSAEQEIARLIPVIDAIRKRTQIPLSVDTRKKAVIQAAAESGANILNDVSALEDDAEIGRFCAQFSHGMPVILMHKRGIPDIMQDVAHTAYTDVFLEVDAYLRSRVEYALSCGIQKDKIVLDPGIGFAKNLAANKTLIRRAGELCDGQFPVLMALSRKTCIGEMTGKKPAEARLAGTVAADVLSVLWGAKFVRVHDVGEAVDSLKILGELTQI